MKILFTGASSFSGFWFVKTLAEAGHQVTCTFTAHSAKEYTGVRGERVRQLVPLVQPVFGVKFGDAAFVELIKKENFHLLCHHAAWVQNYKDFTFDVALAVTNNTHNILHTLQALVATGCKKMIVTGSVFEGGEGGGSDNLPHFSPYGLSKSLTSQIFSFYAAQLGIACGKFVIPNPFGAYEEPRFTSYLMNNWLKGQTPKVNTPDYVRDNIPVSLLALYYNYFCEQIAQTDSGNIRLAPSGIVGSQGMFTQLVAHEVALRLSMKCDFALEKQTSFTEPLIRINTDRLPALERTFNLTAFWDAFAEFYHAK